MNSDIHDVVSVRYLGDHRLFIRFDDGMEGVIDVARLVPLDGVFAPLKDLDAFRSVRVDPELGTIVWPCGADLDPVVLYSALHAAVG